MSPVRSAFAGNILALTSISVTTGATINGRALTRNGAVTLDDNTITAPTCMTGHGHGHHGHGHHGRHRASPAPAPRPVSGNLPVTG
jgi:hypothetical protein